MVRPEYISLKNWAASLLIDYGDFTLPILFNQKKWEAWAVDLLNVPPFRGRNIPAPKKDEDWQVWAKKVYYIMNQENQG